MGDICKKSLKYDVSAVADAVMEIAAASLYQLSDRVVNIDIFECYTATIVSNIYLFLRL